MRLGYLTYGLDRTPTGIGRYATELLRALAKLPAGPEIVLLTTEREDRHALWEQFERRALPGCRLLPGLLTTGNAALCQAAWQLSLDLIHDPNGVAPFFWPGGRTRRIVTIHDAFAYVVPAMHNRLDNWRYRWLLPAAARRADAVLTVSACSRRDLAHYLRLDLERLHVTSVGLDPRFRPVPDSALRRRTLRRYGITQPYVLYVGGINARKNLVRLLGAFAELVRPDGGYAGDSSAHAGAIPFVQLVIAGKRQWATAEFEAALGGLDCKERVVFTGYVDDGDLPALYSGAEVFVFPSLYEGFGLPPVEAMACGTPVVTSSASSLPEVVGKAALLVDPHDVHAIAAAMRRVLGDRNLAAELRQRGLAHVQQFTWERAASQVLQVYERAVGDSYARARAF